MNFIIGVLLPVIILISAFYMDSVRLNKKKHCALGIIVLATILLGFGNMHQQNIAEEKELHIDSLRVLSDTNLAIAKRDIAELKVRFADCDTSKKNIDILLKKPYVIANNTTNNSSNEPELNNIELKSVFDSVAKYPKNKCFSFCLAVNSSNSGKIQVQIKKMLQEKGYKYSYTASCGEAITPLEFEGDGEDGCVLIRLGRF